jgi:hypothetical protein
MRPRLNIHKITLFFEYFYRSICNVIEHLRMFEVIHAETIVAAQIIRSQHEQLIHVRKEHFDVRIEAFFHSERRVFGERHAVIGVHTALLTSGKVQFQIEI